MANTKKASPTREQLAALATKLKGAPAVSNDAQQKLGESIGRADGWASMSQQQRDDYRTQHDLLEGWDDKRKITTIEDPVELPVARAHLGLES